MNRTEIFDHVRAAFDRGRWVLMTDGDGRPREITIDLAERPDDLFGEIEFPTEVDQVAAIVRVPPGLRYEPFTPAAPSDDHGATIPAQGVYGREPIPVEQTEESYGFHEFDAGPTFYEVQIQALARSARGNGIELTMENVTLDDVRRWGDTLGRADRCDWVHVYDRVTRERRTLKRPGPDAVLKGLRDVAADLRGKPYPPSFETGEDGRAVPVESPWNRPSSHTVLMPPVGPLTSTEGLQPGDVLTVGGSPVRFVEVIPERGNFPGELRVTFFDSGAPGINTKECFAFVGRPDADGWIPWAGGENPVPGANVAIQTAGKDDYWGLSDNMDWSDMGGSGYQITRFRIVDTPS